MSQVGLLPQPHGRDVAKALASSRNSIARGGPPKGHLTLVSVGPDDHDQTEMLRARLARAEHDNSTKDKFLAMLAHELRNPLGAISNAVRTLEMTPATGETAARAHDLIGRQVARISRLIDDLLDVERMVSGRIRLHRQPLDMAEAVRRAIATVTGDAGLDRQIEVSTEPVWVEGDAVRLEQVLTNLLTNAVKYTPPAGRIRVTVRADGHDAVVIVEDAGFGIAPGLLPFIFDLYVQGDGTLPRAPGGLGIGLTLVRRLVELHGGTVVASSKGEGHGSRFTVRLKQIPSASLPAGRSCRPQGRGVSKRVLVIEDSDDSRAGLRVLLELGGHAVYDAADGIRGLELLRERPEVGIIDIGLPGMDGHQVARRIREQPHGRGMLLVALSGYSSPDDSKRASACGFDYHLVKPVDLDQLSQLLDGCPDAIQEISA